MRDPNRIPQTLHEIQKIWEKFPDLRLCQLLSNVTDQLNFYYLEDDELIEYLKLYYKWMGKIQNNDAPQS